MSRVERTGLANPAHHSCAAPSPTRHACSSSSSRKEFLERATLCQRDTSVMPRHSFSRVSQLHVQHPTLDDLESNDDLVLLQTSHHGACAAANRVVAFVSGCRGFAVQSELALRFARAGGVSLLAGRGVYEVTSAVVHGDEAAQRARQGVQPLA
eukprot:TRINITY_DN50566_c0_g1_i1.p2 TRINITY_DN50566_c0_g1~~TRINITY_DN50566_c0_g1_i1.p2  ORF type:complete len:154 (-),score=9.09 TRINITY_DN50566_c0_g1_i1:5-466(-)